MVSRCSTAEGQFIHEAQQLAPKDRLPNAEFEAFLEVLRRWVPGAQVIKTGSRVKGTAIEGSDWDYQIETPEEMTTLERDLILMRLRISGYDVSCNKAFTLKTASGASIDFFPQKAQWHDENVSVQKPGSLKFDPGAQNARRKLKTYFPELSSHSHEQLILRIQREFGLKSKQDPSGLRRFLEASSYLESQGHGLRAPQAVYDDDYDDDDYYYYDDDD